MNKELKYKQHVVNTGNLEHQFKETDDLTILPIGGMQISGEWDTVTDCINSINWNEWTPFGYFVRFVYRQQGSKNMTLHLFKL